MKPVRAVFLFFEGMEVLDFAGPLEVLGEAKKENGDPWFELSFAGVAKPGWVGARNNLHVRTDLDIREVESTDPLVIPGGRGVAGVVKEADVLDAVRRLAAAGADVFSICTGAWLLAAAGLLDGKVATSHHLALDRLERAYPQVTWKRNARYVFHEGGLTSAGVSAGIDAAFALLERMGGRAFAEAQARQMEYDLKLAD